MAMRNLRKISLVSCTVLVLTSLVWQQSIPEGPQLDASLTAVLRKNHFSGRVQSSLRQRLGRNLNVELANLGRLLWFDTITGLNDDNTCGGCHSPTNGFGDTQSIAIGIENNGIVGPDRHGPAQYAAHPDGCEHRILPEFDVEFAICLFVGQSFR
jgi:cytochrome c peroxidase